MARTTPGDKTDSRIVKVGKKKQISYRSTPFIVDKFVHAATGLRLTHSFEDKTLMPGHLANAIFLWVGSLEDEELAEFAAPKLRALENYLAVGEGAPILLDDPPAKPKAVQGQPAHPPASRKKHA